MEGERNRGKHRLKFITFTQLSDVDEGPREARDRMRKAFRRLTRRVYWRTNVDSWIASFEETYKDERGWHAHIHVIAACNFLNQNELSVQWASSKNEETSTLVDIREAREGSEQELLKYSLKAANLPAERLVQYAKEMRGLRNLSSGGAWYGIEKESEDDDGLSGEDVKVLCLPYVESLAAEGVEWAKVVVSAVRRCLSATDEPQALLPMVEEDRPPP